MILCDNDLLRLSDEDLQDLYDDLCDRLDTIVFQNWEPGYNSTFRTKIYANQYGKSHTKAPSNALNHDEYIHNILLGISVSHRFTGKRPRLNLRNLLNSKNIQEVETLLSVYKTILNKYKSELFEEAGVKVDLKKDEASEVVAGSVNLAVAKAIRQSENDDDRYVKPQEFDEEKVLVTLESSLFADIIKLNDKYTVRIGDGKYFVASDEIKVVLRDPSQRPSWAIWFMSAVPLDKIPDKAALILLPEKERAQFIPEEIPEQLIVCHASLWKMKGNKTGILLHTSWNHIAATYRWVIDKPIDVASVLFKAVSHPAHLARNFGYIPNLAIPGDDWFM